VVILGIETSCDETSVALVRDGREVLVNLVASQVKLHERFGGVVPELASRAHLHLLAPMIEEALSGARLSLDDVDALAVTHGPGLIGALLVGVETAKALAYSLAKPLIPVHHIAAHLYAPFLHGEGRTYRSIIVHGSAERVERATGGAHDLADFGEEAPPQFPYLGLVVSGGHTSLILVHEPHHFELLGETVDDAAGEAFDKVAKLLGLGYPGGPVVDHWAQRGDGRRFELPRPMLHSGSLDFSFSGLKTAVGKIVRDLGPEALRGDEQLVADVCASFQEAVVEVLLRKAGQALARTHVGELAVVGGVACNSRLRAAAAQYLPGARVIFPPGILCTDNAAMTAGLAWHLREAAPRDWLTLEAQADLALT
jgi:N6-L-threonylcarbamoyladenine synthase